MNAKAVYDIFCKLFPQFVEDVESYKLVNKGSIVVRRKTVKPRPYYIFTYRSEKDWELIYM